MLIYQPISLFPKNISIDGSKPQELTWKSTGAPQTDYQIIIRKNDDDSLVYNSYRITNPISLHIAPKNTMINGVSYKWQVMTWNGLDYAVSDWVLIHANATPVVAFTDPVFDAPIYVNSQDYLFKVSYTQAENISVQRYRFVLYDETGNTILHDSDWIYDIDIQYKISGMLRTESYKIECQAYSQNNQYATTGKQSLTIAEYILPEGTPELDVKALDNIGAVEIKWNTQVAVAEVKDTSGNSKTPKYVPSKFGKGLELASDEEVIFARPVTTDYNQSFHIRLTYGHNGDFVEFDNGLSMGYDNTLNKFYLNNNGTYIYSNEVSLHTWEDFTNAWNTYTGTWLEPNLNPNNYMYNYLFISLSETDFIVKMAGIKIAESIADE